MLGDGAARPPALASAATALKCKACGKAGHTHETCTAVCKDCKLNFCPGVRNEKCVVAAKEPPANVLNANKWPLPKHLQDKLVSAHTARHTRHRQIKVWVASGDSGEAPRVAFRQHAGCSDQWLD